MRSSDFLTFLFGLCCIKRAVFHEIDTESLRHILHRATNITYFEPAGYEKERVLEQHKAACENPDDNAVVIEVYAFDRYFTLILQHDTTLFDKEIRIQSKSKEGTSNINTKVDEFYKGKVSGDQASFVALRLYDGIVDGCFYTRDELYHIEPSSRYFTSPVPFHSLIYRSRDVEFNLTSVKTMGKRVESWRGYDQSESKVSRQSRDIILSNNLTDANTCALHIAADHHLFSEVGKGSVDDTVAEMIFHIAEADKIFRSTDFSGDGGAGDNIGFVIAAITVYQDHIAEDFSLSLSDDTLDYLMEWSKLNHDAFCLSILFTYKEFNDGVLGLAWVGDQSKGGICSKRVLPENSTEGINFNTAILTLSNRGVRVPRKVSIVTVTHELGHSFGAKQHNTNSEMFPREKNVFITCLAGDWLNGWTRKDKALPILTWSSETKDVVSEQHDTRDCIPDEEEGGYYLMYEKATHGTQPNNYLLSECSIAEMWPIIYYKGPQCFIAHNRGIYCGNKIIEDGEECDCGTPAECGRVDTCCNPGNVTSGVSSCKVKDGFHCSPKKGPCCTQDCKYVTAQNVVCHEETECSFKSLCNKATCPPPLSKSSNTTCNHGRSTCLEGTCIGSICTAYSVDQCECTEYEELCHVCCNHTENGCISSSTLSGQVIYQPTGSPCKHFTGYCNEYGQCIIVDTDNQYIMLKEAFKRLVSKASLIRFTRWIKENWYILIILVSSATVVFLMLKYKYKCSDLLRKSTRRPSVEPHTDIPLNSINNDHHAENEGNNTESTTM